MGKKPGCLLVVKRSDCVANDFDLVTTLEQYMDSSRHVDLGGDAIHHDFSTPLGAAEVYAPHLDC
jgi:hypothetical protein